MKRSIFGAALTSSLIVVAVIAGLLLRGISLATAQAPPGWNPEEYENAHKVLLNLRLVSEMVSQYGSEEKSLPSTFSDLANSEYMSVLALDIINPYTNQPIEVVTAPSRGNIKWVYNAPFLTIESNFQKDGQVEMTNSVFDQDFLDDVSAYTNPPLEDHGANEKIGERAAWIMMHSITVYRYVEGALPDTFNSITGLLPYLAKIRNPYTGGYAQNVPADSPSPGNFSYVKSPDSDAIELSWYGDDGELFFQGRN